MPKNSNADNNKATFQQITNTRLWLFVVPALMIVFCICLGRLFYFHVIKQEEYRGQAIQQLTRQRTLPARRGNIYDRNNKILVQNSRVWNICISPRDIEEEFFAEVAANLAEILEIPIENIYKAAETYTSSGDKAQYAVLKYKVDNDLKEKVQDYIWGRETKTRWVFSEVASKRNYVYDNLASTVLGFVNENNQGVIGLEAYYNNELSGTPGIEISVKNAIEADMPYSSKQVHPAVDGYSLVTTIDDKIQASLEKNLDMAILEHNIQNKAAVIFMNMNTGEILGMASRPDFNPNDPWAITNQDSLKELAALDKESVEYKDAYYKELFDLWENKNVTDTYEPGSVYKIVTAAEGLEERLTFLDDVFYCPGYVEFEGGRINCWLTSGHGVQTLRDGVKNSCNPVFIEIGLRLNATRTVNLQASFGFGQKTGIDLPTEVQGILHSQESLARTGKNALANTSFGQAFTVTPIQLATALAASQNGGYLLEPYIVKQIVDGEGNIIETRTPTVRRQVLSEETSAILRETVEGVVLSGTGRNAGVPGYRIGGKTGTSQKLRLLELYNRKEFVLSFAGFAPMDNPTYLCLVILDEPQIQNPLGSVIAAPVVGAIFQEILPYLGLEPQFTTTELENTEVTVPFLTDWKPHDAQSDLTALGLRSTIVGIGRKVIRQIPQAGQVVQKGSAVTLYLEEVLFDTEITVPNFVGLTLEEATKELKKLELNLELRGVTVSEESTVVQQQWPLPDTKATLGDVVILTMILAPEASTNTTLPVIETDP